MFISIYTCVKNGLYYDFHIVEMLKHHLPLADEIVVNEGYSTDGTYEAICNLDPKIRVLRNEWPKPGKSYEWYSALGNQARQACRGQWCIHVDADEFIPDWEFELLREYLSHCEETLIPSRVVDFYGNYKVVVTKQLCWRKMNIHRNIPEVEVWGDGSNVRLKGQKFDFGSDDLRFSVHHFSCVRDPARLREKWHIQAKMHGRGKKYKLPSFVFNWLPHDWRNPEGMDALAVYDGPYIQAVRDNPDEFVRDDFYLWNYLRERSGGRIETASEALTS
jgi:hypothetical protein